MEKFANFGEGRQAKSGHKPAKVHKFNSRRGRLNFDKRHDTARSLKRVEQGRNNLFCHLFSLLRRPHIVSENQLTIPSQASQTLEISSDCVASLGSSSFGEVLHLLKCRKQISFVSVAEETESASSGKFLEVRVN